MEEFNIAVIPGDGIGKEVINEGLKVLNAIHEITGITFRFEIFPWGSDYYLQNGRMMPEDGIDILKGFNAIYLGAVGDPRIPDAVTLRGLLLPIKMELDLYAGVRPAYLYEGIQSKLADKAGGDIDIVVIRENTEGEYSDVGGIVGTEERNQALQVSVFTRSGTSRIIRFAFEYARKNNRQKVTCATKSNAQRFGMVLWDRIFYEIAREYPEIKAETKLIDACCHDIIMRTGSFDVIVASNLFADIISDLTASVVGGLGLAPGASYNPVDRSKPGFFDPVHGSAFDIMGRNIANPIGAILTAKMMLEYLEESEGVNLIDLAVRKCLQEGTVRTADIGGNAKTTEVGDRIVEILKDLA